VRLMLFQSSGIFVLKVLMKYVIFLIGWLGTHMNLRPVVRIFTSHPLASLLMPLLCVQFSIILISTCFLYYISDDSFARLSSMIEIMNRQQAEFRNKMREFDLSHETDLRFSSPKLDVSLCDDGASFTPLESRLEVVLDRSLTISLVVPPSPSTLRDNTTFNMTLPDPPLPLA